MERLGGGRWGIIAHIPCRVEHAVVLWYSSRRAQQRADTKRAANSTTTTLGRGRRKGDGAGSRSNQVHRMLYLRIGVEGKLGCAVCGLGTSTFFRNLHHVSCVQYGSTEYGWVLLFLSFVPGPHHSSRPAFATPRLIQSIFWQGALATLKYYSTGPSNNEY